MVYPYDPMEGAAEFPLNSIARFEHVSPAGTVTAIAEKAAGVTEFAILSPGNNPSLLGEGLLRYSYLRNGVVPTLPLPKLVRLTLVYGAGAQTGVDRYLYLRLPQDGYPDNPVRHALWYSNYSVYFTADGTPYFVTGGCAMPVQHLSETQFTPTQISEQIRTTDGIEAKIDEAKNYARQAESYAASLYRTFASNVLDLPAVVFSGVIPSDGSYIEIKARNHGPLNQDNTTLGAVTSTGWVRDAGWTDQNVGKRLIIVRVSGAVPAGTLIITPDSGAPVAVNIPAGYLNASLVLRDGTLTGEDWGGGAVEAEAAAPRRVATGSAINAVAEARTGTTFSEVGTATSGTYASTYYADGTAEIVTAVAGQIDHGYQFTVPSGSVPVAVNVAGHLVDAGAAVINLYAYNFLSSAWNKIKSAIFVGAAGATRTEVAVPLIASHVSAEKVRLRFQATGLAAGDALHIDRISVGYALTAQGTRNAMALASTAAATAGGGGVAIESAPGALEATSVVGANTIQEIVDALAPIDAGADTVTLTIRDAAGVLVPDCRVWITSDPAGAVLASGAKYSGDDGTVPCLLTDGVEYYCWRRKLGMDFTPNPVAFTAVADAVQPPVLPVATDTVITAFGDSKTDGDSWLALLVASLNSVTEHATALPVIAHAGATSAYWYNNLAPALAAFQGTPTHVLVNLGVNDATSQLTEAEFKAYFGAELDQFHAKWPLAQVGVARVWKRQAPTKCATVNGWIDNVLATRADWTFDGPDESVWLAANPSVLTVDGIHYSDPAGEAENAAQWLAAKIAAGV